MKKWNLSVSDLGSWGVDQRFFFGTVIARWCNCVGLNLEGPACTGPNRLTSAIYRTKQKRWCGCSHKPNVNPANKRNRRGVSIALSQRLAAALQRQSDQRYSGTCS
jgi:hypothetical protein